MTKRSVQRELVTTIGVDLGVRNDHAGVIVVAYKPHKEHNLRRIRVAYSRHWEPLVTTGEVDLGDVLNVVYGLATKFKSRVVRYDPYQAQLMAQTLRGLGVVVQEVPFVGKNLDGMANIMLETFRNKIIDMYPDKHLISDLLKLVIVE